MTYGSGKEGTAARKILPEQGRNSLVEVCRSGLVSAAQWEHSRWPCAAVIAVWS